MRVLGIDCGTERTGFAVVESQARGHRLIAAGVIVTNPKLPLAARLCTIASGLREVVSRHAPRQAAIEEVFHAVNAKSTLKLAHVRGVAMLTVTEAGLPLGEYSPLEVKMSVVGYGRAEKSQVQLMVQSLLQLRTPEELAAVAKEDAADAMAVAICHANQLSTRVKMGVA
jgi:crossover junction endodeoxyribonuclease RuvC